MQTAPAPVACQNVGFLSVFQETHGYIGGYLVTNPWGRPLEFRLCSAVQPNKVQQILYGDTLPGYVCGELIGKTLLDKTTTPVQWVLVDNPASLDLRLHVAYPVALWQEVIATEGPAPGLLIQTHLYCQRQHPEDVTALRGVLEKLGAFDFGEPFARVREALSEARKMGVAQRNAA